VQLIIFETFFYFYASNYKTNKRAYNKYLCKLSYIYNVYTVENFHERAWSIKIKWENYEIEIKREFLSPAETRFENQAIRVD